MDRIQRTRTKGAKLPPNTLCVTRGTLFGNDYKITKDRNREESVSQFSIHIKSPFNGWKVKEFIDRCNREEIKHLACWCGPDEFCHADVWLEIWNNHQAAEEDTARAKAHQAGDGLA